MAVSDKKDKTYSYQFQATLIPDPEYNAWVIDDISTPKYPSVRNYFKDYYKNNHTIQNILRHRESRYTDDYVTIKTAALQFDYDDPILADPQLGAHLKVIRLTEDTMLIDAENRGSYKILYRRVNDGFRITDIIKPDGSSEKADMLKLLKSHNYAYDGATDDIHYVGPGPKAGMTLEGAAKIPGVRFYLGNMKNSAGVGRGGLRISVTSNLSVWYKGKLYPTNIKYVNTAAKDGWQGPKGYRQSEWPHPVDNDGEFADSGFIYGDEEVWTEIGGKITGGGSGGKSTAKSSKRKKK